MNRISTNFILNEVGCSNDCNFCGKSGRENNINENIKREFEKLKQLIKEDCVIDGVEISGNDPIEYKDLDIVVKKIKKITDCKNIIISTHGQGLKDKDFLKRLIEAGVNGFRIPLYGHSKNIHNSVVKNDSAFEKLMVAIKNIENYNKENNTHIYLIITTMILNQNIKNLKELFYIFSKMDFADLFTISFAGFVPDLKNCNDFIPDIKNNKEYLINAFKYAKHKKININTIDIPFCLNSMILNNKNAEISFDGYKHIGLKNYEKPLYLQKIKTIECNRCRYNSLCEGFYKTYIEKKIFIPEPLL